jgi:hypothetical protein
MNSIVDQLVSTYAAEQQGFIRPTSKTAAIEAIDQLKAWIGRMEDFDRFPEGTTGVIVFALLKSRAFIAPDPADFGYDCQGIRTVLNASAYLLSAEIRRGSNGAW